MQWVLLIQSTGVDPGFRRGGGGSYIQKGGGVSYRNFRSGSKLLQGPGQINKQKKIADSRRGGGVRSPKKKPVSAPSPIPTFKLRSSLGFQTSAESNQSDTR